MSVRKQYRTKIHNKRLKAYKLRKLQGEIPSGHLKNLDIAQYDNVVSMGLGLDRWIGAYKPARSHKDGNAPARRKG